MSIVYRLVEILASFIETYILYEIYEQLFWEYKRKIRSEWKYVLAIVGTILIQVGNKISLLSYFTLLMFVLYMSVTALILYKKDFLCALSISSFYALCVSCFDFVIITIISSLWGADMINELIAVEGMSRSIFIVVIKIIWIILFLWSKKYLAQFSKITNRSITIITISAVGFIGVVFLVDQTCRAFDHMLTGSWLVFVVLLVLLLFVSYYVIVFRDEKMKTSFEQMRNNLLEENYKSLQTIYEHNAKTYHDMNNHLNVLYQLLDKGDLNSAKEYLREIGKPITKLAQTIWTGEDVIDVIINSKIEKMRSKGIEMEINVEFPRNTNISSYDMCTILANLLDNAIEATEKLDKKDKITLVMRRVNQFLIIKIINSCDKEKEKFVLYPKTSKEDKDLHGWGLPSVMDVVQKYNGTLECLNENGIFTVTVMLFF